MDKKEISNGLEDFKDRLLTDVLQAFKTRGAAYGRERFSAWRARFSKFLKMHLPNEDQKLEAKLHRIAVIARSGESDAERFWRRDGDICVSFIDSLVTDIRNDEYDFGQITLPVDDMLEQSTPGNKDSVFIVHGHDELTKVQVARFVEKLGLKAIILHEQASGGKTIIEKIEAYTDVGFAIVIYSPDDIGGTQDTQSLDGLKRRARQNVVFEHGYLIGRLGRDKVTPLVVGNIEMPSDVSGIVYVSNANWQLDIAKEMKAVGYPIDFNKLL